jgi:hypothetical protein
LAGTNGLGVWKRPISEMPQNVAVSPGDPGLALCANHPSPFQAGTKIQYSLPRAMPVRLVIHDVAGRAVRTGSSGEFVLILVFVGGSLRGCECRGGANAKLSSLLVMRGPDSTVGASARLFTLTEDARE